MADDQVADAGTVVQGETPAESPTGKKQRAPRRKKEAAATSEAARVAVSKSSPTKVAARNSAAAVKGKAKPPKSVNGAPAKDSPSRIVKPKVSSLPVIDDLSDLIQLEEENARLRKLLAEKLRVENADLRKRLKLD